MTEIHRENKPPGKLTIFLTVIALAVGYAVIRYHVIKGVAWEHFPLYIFNKGISLASIILISLSYIFGPLSRLKSKTFDAWLPLRKFLGIAGFSLGSIHALMSLLLLNPAYYPKFFEKGGQLNLVGELSLLFGVLAFFIFSIVAIASLSSFEEHLDKNTWRSLQRYGYYALFSVLLHVLVMGYAGWLKPAEWPGGLLPVSMVAFIILLFTILLKLISLF